MTSDDLIRSLSAAVDALPDDATLRLHLASLLSARGDRAEAIRHAAVVLQAEPTNPEALQIITAATPGDRSHASEPKVQPTADVTPRDDDEVLAEMEANLPDVQVPVAVSGGGSAPKMHGMERTGIGFGDVAGMITVKERLEATLLAPLRNPGVVEHHVTSSRGGLLLYGPPGCGKTLIARAVAGEMGAHFLSLSLAEGPDTNVGSSEHRIHELFESAQNSAPCVILLDELDALGQQRSNLRTATPHHATTQLLDEMDGVGNSSNGIYLLGATNLPWEVDQALRGPGRLDHMLLVPPPDDEARHGILRYNLQDRPVASVDIAKLSSLTHGYSGADLAYVCEIGEERALVDSARSGVARLIEMPDLTAAIREVRPSTGPWFDVAKNEALLANSDGSYDDLLAYLRQHRPV